MVKHQDSKSARVRELLAAGESVAAIAERVGCKVGLVYNVKSRMNGLPKRGPGRPRKATSTAATELDGFIESIRGSERERQRLHAALQRISAIISEVLQR